MHSFGRTGGYHKPPPVNSGSYQMVKSASAEDLDGRPSPSNDYESDDSFKDVETAVYDNGTYDPELDKLVPKQKQAPPPPPVQGNKNAPSCAAPRRLAPVTAPGSTAVAFSKNQAVQNGTKPISSATNGKLFGLPTAENLSEPEIIVAPSKPSDIAIISVTPGPDQNKQ